MALNQFVVFAAAIALVSLISPLTFLENIESLFKGLSAELDCRFTQDYPPQYVAYKTQQRPKIGKSRGQSTLFALRKTRNKYRTMPRRG
jgi:hypothetical protein